METIRNYLETMFANLPGTPEVLRAKEELYQMMEDRYDAAIADGKKEYEAVGMVISEFGNLDELADTLGISSAINEAKEPAPDRILLSLQQAHAYAEDSSLRSLLIALGVFCCIVSPVCIIVAEAIDHRLLTVIGICFLLLCVASAVVLFIMSGRPLKDWDFLKKGSCAIDYLTSQELIGERRYVRSSKTLMLAIGIVLCVLCPIPAMIGDAIGESFFAPATDLGAAGVLIFVAMGVFLIIYSDGRDRAYRQLLKLNDADTVSGGYVNDDKDKEIHVDSGRFVGILLGVYWPTITLIYLCYSFLTFRWATSWLIWPIAAIVRKILIELEHDRRH